MQIQLPLGAKTAASCQCCAEATEVAPASEVALDPVCGMSVVPAEAPATVVLSDTTYYFCAPGCARAFEADPHRYQASSGSNR